MLSLSTPQEIAAGVALRIRERRLERRWSQRELAARAGLSLGTYILFERSGRISFVRLIRVLDVLGLGSQVEQLAAVENFSAKTIDDITAPRRQRGRRASK